MAFVLSPLAWWSYTGYACVYLVLSTLYQVFAWQQLFQIRSLLGWLKCIVLLIVATSSYCLVVFTVLLGLIFLTMT